MSSQKFLAIVAGEEKEDETDEKKGRNRASWSGSVVCILRCFVADVHNSSLMCERQCHIHHEFTCSIPPRYISRRGISVLNILPCLIKMVVVAGCTFNQPYSLLYNDQRVNGRR